MRIERPAGRWEFLRNCPAGAVIFTAESSSFFLEATASPGQPARSRVSIAHNPLLRAPRPQRAGLALDHTGWHGIERKRAEQGLKTLAAKGRAPHSIETAADAEH